MTAENYDRIDGHRAYHSPTKRLTIGLTQQEQNNDLPISLQIWQENADGKLAITTELPIHQVFDLMIFLGQTLLYFKEAYRLPLLYDPAKPFVKRIGVQGDALSVAICVDNPHITEDIQTFVRSLSNLEELTGERLRRLTDILEELELY